MPDHRQERASGASQAMAQAPLLTLISHGSFGAYRKDDQHSRRTTPQEASFHPLDEIYSAYQRARDG